MSLRVSAISFLNPAPLLYGFEHEPSAMRLRKHYELHYTLPSKCADELNSGVADLGLIPIAALTSQLAIVPGCAIASLDEVRSILLLVKNPLRLSEGEALAQVERLATDAASRSSAVYAHILLDYFHGARPTCIEQTADPLAMLEDADAALLIGDPALLAREQWQVIEEAVGVPLLWLDLARLWRQYTGLPWVAAVWAVRPEALTDVTAQELIADLNASRDEGLAHIDDLVQEWTPRLAISPETIRTYLTRNIHYMLDDDCVRAIRLFRELAAKIGALPPLPELNLLG